MADIPIQIFLGFIFLAGAFSITGIAGRKPILVLIGGAFLMTMAVLPDNVITDTRVIESQFDNSTNISTYSYENEIQPFTDITKVLFAFFGSMVMLIGGLLYWKA